VHSNYNVWGSSHANFKQKTEMELQMEMEMERKTEMESKSVAICGQASLAV